MYNIINVVVVIIIVSSDESRLTGFDRAASSSGARVEDVTTVVRLQAALDGARRPVADRGGGARCRRHQQQQRRPRVPADMAFYCGMWSGTVMSRTARVYARGRRLAVCGTTSAAVACDSVRSCSNGAHSRRVYPAYVRARAPMAALLLRPPAVLSAHVV